MSEQIAGGLWVIVVAFVVIGFAVVLYGGSVAAISQTFVTVFSIAAIIGVVVAGLAPLFR